MPITIPSAIKAREHHKFLDPKERVKREEYSRLFPDLPAFLPDDNLLRKIGTLGGPMEDRDVGIHGDAKVRSAGVTFLGQFITHDISFDQNSDLKNPRSPEEVENYRNPALELDSIYGWGRTMSPQLYDPKDKDLMRIGQNDQGLHNDVPRNPDGTALMGDPRNDLHKIGAQLHLAFLKFHNAVVKYVREKESVPEDKVFERAQQIVRWHFQWIVLHDFLPQVVDRYIIKDVLQSGRKFYNPGERITLPVEFTAAVFRFGHSIVKPHYFLNDVFDGDMFPHLFGKRPIPEKEVVQWRNFFWLDPGKPIQLGRRIDEKIARPLFNLPFVEDAYNQPELRSLAFRTLMRGKLLGLPSGEAVAETIAQKVSCTKLTQDEVGLHQFSFTETPLWYYILREAAVQQDGERLGEVGGRITAEVFIGLLQLDKTSFMHQRDWKPHLPSAIPGHFSIEDLMKFAGVAYNKADQWADRDSKKRYKREYKYKHKRRHAPKYDPVVGGRWDILGYASQIEAVHMSLLPTGKVLYYSGYRVAEAVDTETRLWYPKWGEIKKPLTPADLFCGGHCLLPNGDVLTTGGTLEYRNLPPIPPWIVKFIRPLSPLIVDLFGRRQKVPLTFAGPTYLYRFDMRKEEWVFAGDMEGGRWYPTNTLLPDGTVLIMSGTDEAGGFGMSNRYAKINRRLEVYDLNEGLKWVATIPDFPPPAPSHEHMSGIEPKQPEGGTPGHVHTEGHDHGIGIKVQEDSGDLSFPNVYPRNIVMPLKPEEKAKYPKGKVFTAGYGPETKMLDLATWEWEDVGNTVHGIRWDGCCALLPLRPPDYRARVLIFGGSTLKSFDARGNVTAEVIDFGEEKPEWVTVKDSYGARVNGLAVLLPDGKVLATGGNSTAKFKDPEYRCEVFDPATETWELVSQLIIPRGYHCTALLLEDGRVLQCGTTPFGKYELGMEVWSPYYLFKGPRPVIVDAPKEVGYGQDFTVHFQFSWPVKKVVLIAAGSVTHSFDMNQRYIQLEFTEVNSRTLSVKAPPDAHVAPPQYYMLWLLSEEGVPSVAWWVRVWG